MIFVLWTIYGYSVAFTGGNPFIGGFDKLFLKGITAGLGGRDLQQGRRDSRADLRRLPGHLRRHHLRADRRRLRRAHQVLGGAAVLVLWFTFSYLPIAHMVWYWDGPDAITDAASLDEVTAAAGWLWAKGALDFAGGTVVHINAGVAGLVGAYLVGKRIGYGKESLTPHSLTLTMVGASLLWVGWFGFNAGSNLEANGMRRPGLRQHAGRHRRRHAGLDRR